MKESRVAPSEVGEQGTRREDRQRPARHKIAPETRAAGTAGRVTQTRACAADLAPTPAALQGKGLIMLAALAEALTARGVLTACGATM